MKAPSTRTLLILATVTLIGSGLLAPMYHPGPIPVLGPDSLPVRGADGTILSHPNIAGIAELHRLWIPSELLLACAGELIVWLVVRLCMHLFNRVRRARKYL